MEGVGDSPDNILVFLTDDGHRVPIHQGGQATKIASGGGSIHEVYTRKATMKSVCGE